MKKRSSGIFRVHFEHILHLFSSTPVIDFEQVFVWQVCQLLNCWQWSFYFTLPSLHFNIIWIFWKIISFPCNAKIFAFAFLLFSYLFSIACFDWLRKAFLGSILSVPYFVDTLANSNAYVLKVSVWEHDMLCALEININPFQANAPFLYPLKTLENLQFSDVFRGNRKGTLTWNGLMIDLGSGM